MNRKSGLLRDSAGHVIHPVKDVNCFFLKCCNFDTQENGITV